MNSNPYTPFGQSFPSLTGERWHGWASIILPSFTTRLKEQPVPQYGQVVVTYLISMDKPRMIRILFAEYISMSSDVLFLIICGGFTTIGKYYVLSLLYLLHLN
jgi:hypothetical protein